MVSMIHFIHACLFSICSPAFISQPSESNYSKPNKQIMRQSKQTGRFISKRSFAKSSEIHRQQMTRNPSKSARSKEEISLEDALARG